MIAKLDSGHRGEVLSVAELLIIAAALEVPPIVLLYPNLPDGEVERVPGEVDTAISAIRWFIGESDSDGKDLPDRLDGDKNPLAQLLRLSKMREGTIYRAERWQERKDKMKAAGTYDSRQWADPDFESMVREIEIVMRQIQGSEVTEWPGPFGIEYRVDDDA